MTSPITHHVFHDDQEEVRKTLCEVVESEKERFLQLAQAFYDGGQRTEQQCLELTNAIVAAVDHVLQAGDWDSSLFLRNIIKPLREIRAKALQAQSELMRVQGLEEIGEYQLKANEVKIYISLFQAEGHDLQKWEAQLRSIHAYMAGRPVYKNEEDARKAVRQKILQTSEAYAIAVVDKAKILENDFGGKKTDRQGFELLTIQLGAVTSQFVVEFVHLGKRYHFYNQRLILKEK
ncbi:MAG: Dot/Icm secretion system protein IcmQ [Coxiella sp. RIFCSPHIGHO2_12_FULL_42_15]|nr:MAG: Dot/Icm secretion system protein IcmQ [Coxiella sp. RIFCSPHIGHO2_12_FULL_42_15]